MNDREQANWHKFFSVPLYRYLNDVISFFEVGSSFLPEIFNFIFLSIFKLEKVYIAIQYATKSFNKTILWYCKIIGLTQTCIIQILTIDKQRKLKYKYWITAACALHTESQILVENIKGNLNLPLNLSP